MPLFGRKEEGITPESLQRAVAEGLIDRNVTIELLRRSLSGKSPVEQMLVILKQFVPSDKRCEFKALPSVNVNMPDIPRGLSRPLQMDFENLFNQIELLLKLPIVRDGFSSRYDPSADNDRDRWVVEMMEVFGGDLIQPTLRANILRKSFWNAVVINLDSIVHDSGCPRNLREYCDQLFSDLAIFNERFTYDYLPLDQKLRVVIEARGQLVEFVKKFPRS